MIKAFKSYDLKPFIVVSGWQYSNQYYIYLTTNHLKPPVISGCRLGMYHSNQIA